MIGRRKKDLPNGGKTMDEDIPKKTDRALHAPLTIDLSDITWDTPILLRIPILPGFPGIMEYKVCISGLEFNSGAKQLSLTFDIPGLEKKP